MKKLFLITLLAVILSSGCASKYDDFVKDSGDIYTQMFIDGDQTTKVNDLFEAYEATYGKYKDDELYEAIEGMYHGLADGTATGHQLEAMRILNEHY